MTFVRASVAVAVIAKDAAGTEIARQATGIGS